MIVRKWLTLYLASMYVYTDNFRTTGSAKQSRRPRE